MSAAPSQNPIRKNAFLDDAILFRFSSSLPTTLLAGFEEIGAFVASREAQDLARLANIHRPSLRRDPSGLSGIITSVAPNRVVVLFVGARGG